MNSADNIQNNTFNKSLYTSKHLDCKDCTFPYCLSNLKEKFVELKCDDETISFINTCVTSKWQLHKATYIRPWLSIFYNITEANAILDTGTTFLFTKEHLKALLKNSTFKSMLDIGAGDGNVTDRFRPYVENSNITCLEDSVNMIKVLSSKGYTITDSLSGEYELVSCLNVYDRCKNPISLLKAIFNVKKKVAILSFVVPFEGFYYKGKERCRQEEDVIGLYEDWEENAFRLHNLLVNLGFKIDVISRVPYVWEGDLKKEVYGLDTVIFVVSNEN